MRKAFNSKDLSGPITGMEPEHGTWLCRTPSWLSVVSGHACFLGGCHGHPSPALCYFQVSSNPFWGSLPHIRALSGMH